MKVLKLVFLIALLIGVTAFGISIFRTKGNSPASDAAYTEKVKAATVEVETTAEVIDELVALNLDAVQFFENILKEDTHDTTLPNYNEREAIYDEFRREFELFKAKRSALDAYMNAEADVLKVIPEQKLLSELEKSQTALLGYEAYLSGASLRFQDMADRIVHFLNTSQKIKFEEYVLKNKDDSKKFLHLDDAAPAAPDN